MTDFFGGDLRRCARRELARRPLRTTATVLGYALAVALLVVIVQIMHFTEILANPLLETTGTHFITYAPSCGNIASLTEAEIDGLLRGVIPEQCQELCKNCTGCNKKPLDLRNEGFVFQTTTTRLLSVALVDRVRRLADVKDATPYLLFRLRDDRDRHFLMVGGFDPASPEAVGTTACAKADLVAGEFLTPESSGRVMADAGYALAQHLTVGSTVTISSMTFTVAGIVNTGVRPAKADLYMLFDQAEKVINSRLSNPLSQEMNLLFVATQNPEVHERVRGEVMALMASNVFSSYNCYKPAGKALKINRNAGWLIVILVWSGVVGLCLRSQWASVASRWREIGILKALGWSDRHILTETLLESLYQALWGGAAGCSLALVVLVALPAQDIWGVSFRVPPAAFLITVLVALSSALAAGFVAGALPAWAAARRKPHDLMRYS